MTTRLQTAINLYLEGIRDGNARAAIEAYTGGRYTQHPTGVADGREGFLAFFEPFLERNPERDIRIVRGWEDGRHVFLHVYQSLNGGDAEWERGAEQLALVEVFRLADGMVVEHWDKLEPVPERNVNSGKF